MRNIFSNALNFKFLKASATTCRFIQLTHGVSKNLSKLHRENINRPQINLKNMNNKESDGPSVNIKVEYLEPPVKSANDKKEYRVIKLPNGLTALLIADLENKLDCIESRQDETSSTIDDEKDEDESEFEETDDENDEDDDGDDENDDDDDDDDGDSVGAKPSKREGKMAACGLCVGVGSFSDPPEIPGMAHFLEHMVFMGSEKYPIENDFDVFIRKHGGSDNASTECEQTTFHFEINEKHLLPALDRFAQFFVSPLMMRDAITREREAVESEFQMALTSDCYRKEQLFCSFAQPGHPAAKFTWGNLVTLKENVTEDKLYEELHKFRQRHYSAHRMTVAIQARLSLDTLEEYVKQCFADVPNNALPSEDFSKFIGIKSFDTLDFRRIHKMKPIKDVRQIELTWAMPSLLRHYRTKPHQYVSWIIGHEGKGSLISYLRKKLWCLDIFSGNGESGFEHSSMYALFSLSLVLTDDGNTHLKDVLDAIFSYINMIKKMGPQKRIYDEIQQIEETNFRFADEEQPEEYVEEICESMHLYPSKDYITGSELYFQYDAESITSCINALTPDAVNIMIFDKKFDDETFEKTEPWFKSKYTSIEIPEDWTENWKSIEPFDDFHLPEPNKFVTDDFTLIPIEEQEYPVKIHEDKLSEIWYKSDPKFRVPECYMNILLITPLATNSPEGSVMIDFMVGILKQLLIEELYPATAASINHQIQPHSKGLSIKIWGFNQRLPLLLHTIVTLISQCSDCVQEDLFNVVKQATVEVYYNTFVKPSKLNKDLRLSILMLNHWTAVDKFVASSGLTFSQFQNFCKVFTNHIYAKCLVQGNMKKTDVIEGVLNAFTIMKCRTLLPNTLPEFRVMILPEGTTYCKIKNLNLTDCNSVITNYYQAGLSSMKHSVIIELIIMIMEEPLFNQLRTQEMLGYEVNCQLRDTFGIMGYSVTVCTQANKFSVEHINNRIEEFMSFFTGNVLKNMTELEFENIKDSLIKLKQCADIHLKEEVTRNWAEITSGEYKFDRLTKEIDAIRKINLDEIKEWIVKHNVGGTNCRKLSLQVVGVKKDESNKAEGKKIDEKVSLEKNSLTQNEENGKCTLTYLKNEAEGEQDKPVGNYIVDVEDFKRRLYVFPIHYMDSKLESDR